MVEQLTFYTINTGALTTCVVSTSHNTFWLIKFHYSSVSVVILMLVSPPPG